MPYVTHVFYVPRLSDPTASKITTVRVMTPCSLVESFQWFGKTCCFNFSGLPWRWRHHVPPNSLCDPYVLRAPALSSFSVNDCGLVGSDAVQSCKNISTFQRTILPPNSGMNSENGGSKLIRNVGTWTEDRGSVLLINFRTFYTRLYGITFQRG
jgi:hypothetical protein